MFNSNKKTQLPLPEEALSGRSSVICVPESHFVSGHSIVPPFPENLQQAIFAMGCFWGAEKIFWQLTGVYCTAVGYANGYTPNPYYEEVCSGLTGHAEVVKVIFDPEKISYHQLLAVFWESHNPTQGMRQGVDIGTQYRSAIYTLSKQQAEMARDSKVHYQQRLTQAGFGSITTEIEDAKEFYYAENFHQQYLAKIPQSGNCDGSMANDKLC